MPSRVAQPATALFGAPKSDDWTKEVQSRESWTQSLKTVEAAKDKTEGLKSRAKGKRGGDCGRRNSSAVGFDAAAEDSSVLRRDYQYKPGNRNPIMAGNMEPEEYRPGVKQVDPPRTKALPKTHKVVNLAARCGHLGGRSGDKMAVLAGAAGEAPTAAAGSPRSCGRRVTVDVNRETQPPTPKPSGRAGRKTHEPTDPWKYVKSPEPFHSVNYREKYPQRYGSTPESARRVHTFASNPAGPRNPEYKLCPPYSIGDN